jgi:hypothetical protein
MIMTTNLVRTALAIAYLAFGAGIASAQPLPGDKSPTDSKSSTGRTVFPETKGPLQPQGRTGPLETEGPAAPADNPQGETPPGMQTPEASSKSTGEPKK